jgi:dynein heavy chain
MSKVIQGVVSGHEKFVGSKLDLVRLWYHEHIRVYGDRLVSVSDNSVLETILMESVSGLFRCKRDEIFESERLIYGDFQEGNLDEGRAYKYLPELKVMQTKIEEYLEDYNSMTKIPMKLIMFLDACDHCARIARILRAPMGNALLLGVGGSGR